MSPGSSSRNTEWRSTQRKTDLCSAESLKLSPIIRKEAEHPFDQAAIAERVYVEGFLFLPDLVSHPLVDEARLIFLTALQRRCFELSVLLC